MKYLIIGAGATGCAVGAHLANSGKDVTFIARGRTLEALEKDGMTVIKPAGNFKIHPVKVFSMEGYGQEHEKNGETPDIIFVCVKGYSIDETIPFIKRIAGSKTIVIPILNIYTTGEKMQIQLPEVLVTDGCIYVAAEITEPGTVLMHGDILRVVFGLRDIADKDGNDTKGAYSESLQSLERIYEDLNESGILGILSKNIRRDALMKFAYVSAQSACGVYYDVPAGPMQRAGEIRDCFAVLVGEIVKLANAMGITFEENLVERNLKILDDLDPEFTTSMQRDLMTGKKSEIDGQIYEVIRTAHRLGVELPTYENIAAELKRKYQ